MNFADTESEDVDAAEWLNWMNNHVVCASDDEGKFHFDLKYTCTTIKLKCLKDCDSGGGSTTTDDDIELEIELFRLYGSGTDSLETNTYDTQSSSNNHFPNSYHEHDEITMIWY